jgi:hypothetical protein
VLNHGLRLNIVTLKDGSVCALKYVERGTTHRAPKKTLVVFKRVDLMGLHHWQCPAPVATATLYVLKDNKAEKIP